MKHFYSNLFTYNLESVDSHGAEDGAEGLITFPTFDEFKS